MAEPASSSSPLIDSYAAGLIDGEGYIGIQGSGGSYQLRLKVSMTDKGLPALLRMHRTYGGSLNRERQAQEATRETHTWRVTGQRAALVIEAALPALLVKRESAEIGLQFQAMIDSAPRRSNRQAIWDESMHTRAREFVTRIQHANRVGPDSPEPPLPSRVPTAIHSSGTWWEPVDDLFGPVEFEGRFPTNGLMIAGRIYELPTSAHPTDDSASSSLQLLDTPDTMPEAPNKGSNRDQSLKPAGLGNQVRALLPTPNAADGMGGPGNSGRDGGNKLRTEVTLLPTPAVNDMGEGKTVEAWDEWTERQKAKHGNGNGHGASLAIEAQRLLPTPRATDGTKGGPNQRGSSGDLMLPSAVMLLPTPRAQNGEDRNQKIYPRPLDQPQNLENALARLPGEHTNPPSDAGKPS